jgi:phosphoribosyl 1,2-cyclic phosphodiesterase
VRLRFHGVRGSTPAPGRDFVRTGGHTSCVAVSRGDEDARLVLDAGTGLQALSRARDHRPFSGTILLTHLHWDHLQGLPFFRAGDQAGSDVTLVIPAQGDPLEVLRRGMSPPHFPIGPDELLGTWRFEGLEPGTSQVEDFTVTAAEIPHKGGRTYGYRVESDGAAVAYLSDHCIDGIGNATENARRLCEGVDLLVHDAQFLASERGLAAEYGHSTIDEAIDLAVSAGVRRLVLFHHGPARTDDDLDRILSDLGDAPVPVTLAREGETVDA